MNDQLSQLTDTLIKNITSTFLSNLQEQVTKHLINDVNHKLSQIDFVQLVREHVGKMAVQHMNNFTFPSESIPPTAIKLDELKISGNHIESGIITKFSSTGIQDNATACQVTILDQATVFENSLVAAGLQVAGNAVIEGDLTLKGDIDPDSPFYRDIVEHSAGMVRASLNEDLFAQYSDIIFSQIKENGVDLGKITLNGKELVTGSRLGFAVTESNLQTVGHLKELLVSGETSLSGSLYTNKKRVGINTIEPSAALSIWDEECEIVVAKRKKDTAIIGTTRTQAVVLSSNGYDNVTLETDGSTTIADLRVGEVHLSSAKQMPAAEAKKGSVVFNENPESGKPLFWVSMGGARWVSGPSAS